MQGVKATPSQATYLRFNATAVCIPHPAKAQRGGEDAFFISSDGKSLGVFDGVGGWNKHGVDPGVFSKALALGCKKAAENGVKKPTDMMKHAYKLVAGVPGSSTAIVITLQDGRLRSANIGDSGFMLLRQDMEKIHALRSHEQQHGFNHPYQLATVVPSDLPDNADELDVDVKRGDVIICYSDGFSDNIYTSDAVDILRRHLTGSPSNPVDIDGFSKELAFSAFQLASKPDYVSPFVKNAQAQGYDRVSGGKMDDITVIAGYIY
mmetsp:Transcript_1085/g.1239  ORF Transcript_1085/g.1239 Transcript_1085/m.1239 type:complete len:264 (+) Transcript_1085:96-887(+)